MSDGKTLTTKQMSGALALLTAATREDAAKLAGVSSKTLARWEQLPAFRAALSEGRRALFQRAVNRVLSRLEKALDAIEKNLTCGTPNAEIRAAEAMMSAAMRWHESDVEERLDEIRATLEQVKNAQR